MNILGLEDYFSFEQFDLGLEDYFSFNFRVLHDCLMFALLLGLVIIRN